MTEEHNPPCTPQGEYQGETLDSFSEQLQEDITRIWNQRYQDNSKDPFPLLILPQHHSLSPGQVFETTSYLKFQNPSFKI